MSHPVPPELPGIKPSTNEYTWTYPWLQMHRQQRMALLDIEVRRGPLFWEGLILQCRGLLGQGRGSGLIGKQGEGRWIMGFSVREK